MIPSPNTIDGFAQLFRAGTVAAFVAMFSYFAWLLPLGDARFMLGLIAYVATLFVIVTGYAYASFIWGIPKMHWLAIIPVTTALVIWAALMIAKTDAFDDIGLLIGVGLWVLRVLAGFIVIAAMAGWIAYLGGRNVDSKSAS
jgi:hypothetical protein